MKTLLTLAAALGMVPAAAAAQAPAAGQAAEAVGSNSQGNPPSAQAFNQPSGAEEEPSDAQVLEGSLARTAPEAGVGQPDGRMLFQDQVTAIGEEAVFFHNWILLPLITVISLFVLALLLYVVVRFRRGRNPVPSRNTHNTALEVVWTLVPVLILVAIAVPSIRLLANKYSPPAADLTVKITGNRWYWSYEYPDHGGFTFDSLMLTDQEAKARGEPRLLGVDERMVVPAGATVKVIITASDVVHSWGIPAFWVKLDAVPGRLNETWFKVDKPGIYYGQCFELCGARHAYMPIAVEVVPPAQFAAWIASKGGTMAGAQAAATPPAAAGEAGADLDAEAEPDSGRLVNASAAAAVGDNQAATSNPGISE